MLKVIFFFLAGFISFCSTKLNAQVFKAVFVDTLYQPIEGLPILNAQNNKVVGFTNSFGFFYTSFDDVKTIKTKSIFWKEYSFSLPQNYKNDTLERIIKLIPKKKILSEIQINQQKFKRLFYPSIGQVLDYYPISNKSFFVLRKQANEYSLKIEHTEKENLFSDNLTGNPKSLFKDYKNNIYIEFKDSLCQIYLKKDSLIIIDKIKAKNKIRLIKSIICLDSNAVYSGIHNYTTKYYELNKLSNGIIKTFFTEFDNRSFDVINSYRANIISRYMQVTDPDCNIISLGLWNKDLIQLTDDLENFRMYSFLQNILNKRLKIASFKVNKGITTISLERDSLYFHSLNGNLQYATGIKMNFKRANPEILKDYLSNQFYIFNNDNLYHLNELTGELTLKKRFDFVKFPKKIKIYGNDVYFLARNTHQIFKLCKTKISY